jgi:hypothetical protein
MSFILFGRHTMKDHKSFIGTYNISRGGLIGKAFWAKVSLKQHSKLLTTVSAYLP